jgi:16S rRNA (cytosine1402-N4)-methyltransferase
MPKQKQKTDKIGSDQILSHTPVLVTEVLDYLKPKAGESYLDLTAGYGGHAAAIIGRTEAPQAAVLVDRDIEAVKALKKRFGDQAAEIIHMDYLEASRQLYGTGRHFNLILADLGVSSPHIEDAARGFSFSKDSPLDMRMDQAQELSAAAIVNGWNQKQLESVLSEYGQEPKSRLISQMIIENRPISSTSQLAAIVKRAWPGHSRVHPATRTFQALRIAVNDELKQLEQSLPLWIRLLTPNGRLAIISFHSLEDRLVKQTFAEHSRATYDANLKLLTKKPVTASPSEIASNPRSRSSRLRAAAKIKTKIERN